jgi:hypothetical protein
MKSSTFNLGLSLSRFSPGVTLNKKVGNSLALERTDREEYIQYEYEENSSV